MKEISANTLYLIVLCAIEAGLLLLGNILGGIIWGIDTGIVINGNSIQFIQDGGILVFPIIYVVTDLIVELYGKEVANQVAKITCKLNAMAFCFCFIATKLPVIPGTNSEIMQQALGFSTRVLVASIIGFYLSQVINNYVFQYIKEHFQKNSFFARSIGSSFIARIVDTMVFNVLAFAGRGTTISLVQQIAWAFIVPSILEIIINPITKVIAKRLSDKTQAAA